MNESSEAWDEYVLAGMEQVLALLVRAWFCDWTASVCVCVCVCLREAGREGVFSRLKWVPALHEYSGTPHVPLMSHWCRLACGKTSCPSKTTLSKPFLLLKKKQKRKKGMCTIGHPLTAKRAGLQPATKYRWVKWFWSHVALLELGQHLGHMFRSVTLHWEIL